MEVLAKVVREDNKCIHTGKEKIKLCFSGCLGNEESTTTKSLLELISSNRKVLGYKVYIQKSTTSL